MRYREGQQRASGMTGSERRAAFSLAGIFSLRMLGLFLILPVFAIYAERLDGVTPVLVGLAIGIYGLTQAMFQIPMGMVSDRIGRKPVIVAGLLVFAFGSVVAAMADSIYGVIAGRALQGSGAIAAAVMALAADLTREDQRTKAMAVIGMSIGLAFAAALIFGPVLNGWVGVPGIFWLTAFLALVGVAITVAVVPRPARIQIHRDAEPVAGQFGRVLSNLELIRLDLGILIMHLVMTAMFLVVPLRLRDLGMETAQHWQVYLPVLVISVIGMVPLIILAERFRRMKPVFIGSIAALMLAEAGLYLYSDGVIGLAAVLILFFISFNFLEAALPSLVSKLAPAEAKGTAMGVYSSSQFAGAFLGGILGGWMHHRYGIGGVYLLCMGAAGLWLMFALGMSRPRNLSNYLLRVGKLTDDQAENLRPRLQQIKGVAEVVVIADDETAYLKVDFDDLDRKALGEFSTADA